MAVRVQLNDGVELILRVGLEEMREAYRRAVDNNQLLEVESADGKTRAVNPNQILFFEKIEEDAGGDVADQAREMAPDSGPVPAH